MTGRGPAIAALLLAGATACHRPARVYLRDGRVVTGRITPGDGGHLVVGGTRVARADVRRIAHPGRGAAIAGTVVAVVFGMGAVGSLTHLDDQPDLARLTLAMSASFCAAGAGAATWGWTVWSRSKAAARPPVAPLVVAPPLASTPVMVVRLPSASADPVPSSSP